MTGKSSIVNVEAFSCASCHGDGARTGTDYVKAAPPVGSRGETAESTLAVGAHAAHVYSPTLTNGYACTECHVAPPLTDVGPPALHANGTVAMQFGTIANQGGTSTTWNRAAATCSASYCHGAFAGGQLTNAPNWTLGDSQATCGSCHGAPPPAPHPQSTACGGCHPGFGPGTVDRNVHANGALNVSLTCSSCHGDPARAGTDQRKAAPPAGTNGETAPTTLAVGAHARHLDGGALSRAIACTECHVVPTSMGHPDGTRQITFGALATTGSAPTSWVRTAATCTNYCHGSTLPGGTNRDPDWRGGAPEAVCGSCHGAPPPSPHSQNPNCGGCHDGYTSASVNLATHVDGHLDLRADFSCSSCHGDSSRVGSDLLKAAPPAGTAGETSTTQLAVGAHQVHLTDGGLANAMACTSCHAVPTSLAHPDGTAQIQWGGLATQGGAAPVWDRTTGTCSNTYCHGNYSGTHHYDVYDFGSDTLTPMTYDYAGSNATPTWTAGAACGSCHGSPPTNSESGSWHGFHGGGNQCQLCHPDATGLPGSATISNPALHVNGVVELAPRWQNSIPSMPSRISCTTARPGARSRPTAPATA
jgi:predicted CxxxxCH...CXXCH cytochrome family protein